MERLNPIFARLLFRRLSSLGVDDGELFENVGFDAAELRRASEISKQGMNQMLRNAIRLRPNDPIAFYLGLDNPFLGLGRLGIAMINAPSLGAGLMVLSAYTRTEASYVSVRLKHRQGFTAVELDYGNNLDDLLPYHTVPGMLLVQSYCEHLLGRQLENTRFEFAFPAPADLTAFEEHFQGPSVFNCSQSAVLMPRDFLEALSPYCSQGLWQRSMGLLDESLRELGRSDVGMYSEYLYNALKARSLPLPNLERMADELNVSSRTLSRRLNNEGKSFRGIRNRVLNEFAQEYLAETRMSVEAISLLLGYQDVSNFRRAFVAMNGQTPRDFRKLA